MTSTSVVISCSFIPGTLCQGCHVKLIFGNVTQAHNISRVGSKEEEIDILEGIDTELAVSVFDWEQDGSVGILPIVVDVTVMKPTTEGNLISTL